MKSQNQYIYYILRYIEAYFMYISIPDQNNNTGLPYQ